MKLVLVLVLMVSTSASAQPAPAPEPVSPATAGAISVIAGLGGLGIMTAGIASTSRSTPGVGGPTVVAMAGWGMFALGPSLGHMYAESPWHTGLQISLVGIGLTGIGVAAMTREGGSGLGQTAAFGGIVTTIVGSCWSMATAPAAAREHNRKLATRRVTLAPSLGAAPGLVLAGSF